MKRILLVLVMAGATASPIAGDAAPQPSQSSEIPDAVVESLKNAGAPDTAIQAMEETQGLFEYMDPVGDLDGDRAADVVRIAVDEEAGDVLFEGRRGLDGHVFWEHRVSPGWGWAMPARLGPDGKPGVLIVSFQGTAGVGALSLTAFVSDAPSPAWTRTFDAYADTWVAGLYVPVVVGGDHIPRFMGLGRANHDAAQDALVHSNGGPFSVFPAAYFPVAMTQVVSGSDGMPFTSAAAIPATYTQDWAKWVGDLSGDGLDDYVVGRYRLTTAPAVQPNRMEVRRAIDGALVWGSSDGPAAYSGPVIVGDATGDGKNDIAVAISNYHDFALLDGRDGRRLWSLRGRFRPIGDTNRDGRSEILVATLDPPLEAGAATTTINLSVVDGARRTLARTAHFAGLRNHFRWSFSGGDYDGDRVLDVSYSGSMLQRGRTIALSEVVSGRTTKRIRGGVIGKSLMGSVDGGPGHDAYAEWWRGRVRNRFVVIDGKTGRMIWSIPISVTESQGLAARAADLTGDGRAEVLVGTGNGMGSTVTVLRSSDGRPLWR